MNKLCCYGYLSAFWLIGLSSLEDVLAKVSGGITAIKKSLYAFKSITTTAGIILLLTKVTTSRAVAPT